MSRVLELITQTPWAILPEALEQIAEIAAREHSITPEGLAALEAQAIASQPGQVIDGTSRARMREGGVAVLPVRGPIFRYGNLFTAISGATSSEVLANDFAFLLAEPQTRQIILEVDSPGGMANGTSELAAMIRRARGVKPVTTFISGTGASAAYWIGSAAERVYASAIAMVGSVGAVIEARDTNGPGRIEIVSSQSPRKRMDPFAEDAAARSDARAAIQKLVDDLAQVFVEDVAANRGVSVETVLAEFGQGGLFVGTEAQDAGLVDGITTLEELITQMQAEGGRRGGAARSAAGQRPSSSTTREREMSDNTKAGGNEKPVIDRAYLEANHPELVAELRAEGASASAEAHATAERERILAIQALEGPADVVAECVTDPKLSAGDAALKILAANRDRDKARADAHLKSRSDTEEGLDAPSPAAHADTEATETRARAKRIVALHRQLRGQSAPASA